MYLVDPPPARYRTILIQDARERHATSDVPLLLPQGMEHLATQEGAVQDALGRPWHDLRISVTDQCNFRCRYCMPKEVFGRDYAFLPHRALLSFDEIAHLVATAVPLGVRKVRLTGGEPLLRKHLEHLIATLAAQAEARAVPLDIAMTSNGSLLAAKAAAFRSAGLGRITVSLDALDERIFQQMSDADVSVATVLRGIDAALRAGFERVKVNVVVRRGWNEDQIVPMARHFLGMPVSLRFIEFMDVGQSNGWSMAHVVPGSEILERLQREFHLTSLAPATPGETARRWAYQAQGAPASTAQTEIGLINSVTQAFCGDCNRARITADGQLFTCLFAQSGVNLLPYLRGGDATAKPLGRLLRAVWSQRTDRYSEVRKDVSVKARANKAEMNYLGG